MINFAKFLSTANYLLYRLSSPPFYKENTDKYAAGRYGIPLICLFVFAGGLKAQPFLGTNSFATGSTVTLAASAACTSNRTVTYLGFQFTLRSGVNCAMNNTGGGASDGHINFITTPLTTNR